MNGASVKSGIASGNVAALGDHSGANGSTGLDGIVEQGLAGDGAGVQAGDMDISGGGGPFKMEP